MVFISCINDDEFNMKKLVLLCSFGLLGSFAMASNSVSKDEIKKAEDEEVLTCTICEDVGANTYCGTGADCTAAQAALNKAKQAALAAD